MRNIDSVGSARRVAYARRSGAGCETEQNVIKYVITDLPELRLALEGALKLLEGVLEEGLLRISADTSEDKQKRGATER